MTCLRAIGYWRERGRELTDDAWRADPKVILAAIGPSSPAPFLLSYLREGHEFEVWRGWSWCRLECDAPGEVMGHSDLTDGKWIWPQGLVHYIEAHALALPDEFVADARRCGGKVPPLPRALEVTPHQLKRATVDPTFWNDWFVRIAARAR